MWVGPLLSVHKPHRTNFKVHICCVTGSKFINSYLLYTSSGQTFLSLTGLHNTKVWKLFVSKINGRKTDQRTWTKHGRPRDQYTQVLFKLFNEKSSPVDNLFKSSTTGLECSVWYWMPGLCPNRWILGIPIGVLVVGSVFAH